MKKRALLLVGLLVVFGLAIPNLYSQIPSPAANPKKSFWDFFRSKPAAVKPIEIKPTQVSPGELNAYGTSYFISSEEIAESRNLFPPILLVVSPSIDASAKQRIDAWIRDNVRNGIAISSLTEALKKSADTVDYKSANLLIGSFDLNEGTSIRNAQIWGLSKELADKLSLPPTVLNVKGKVYLKNNTKIRDATFNLYDNVVLEDYSEIIRSNIAIKAVNASVVLAGKEHTSTLRDSNLSCEGSYDPNNLSGHLWSAGVHIMPTLSYPGGIVTIVGDGELWNNEIHHCNIGIWVEPGVRLTADGNNIHHTTISIFFNAACDSTSCAGWDNPPLGELTHNRFESSKIAVVVQAGKPDIHPSNTFERGEGMQIGLLNQSAHTIASPLVATENRWVNIGAGRYFSEGVLDATYDHYSSDEVTWETLINHSSNPKFIVNLGNSTERMPQTQWATSSAGCSLMR